MKFLQKNSKKNCHFLNDFSRGLFFAFLRCVNGCFSAIFLYARPVALQEISTFFTPMAQALCSEGSLISEISSKSNGYRNISS